MKINIKDSTLVRPAQDAPQKRLWLSNLDVHHPIFHIPVIYFYKPDGSSNFFESKVLKEALSKVLVPFYPTAGRLARDENDRLEINCNGEGVLLVEAEADCSLSDLRDLRPSSELKKLLPEIDYSCPTSCPLHIFQVTKFSCGAVCLALGCLHVLADGVGITNFVNSWSEVTRGLSITNPPLLERTILGARDPPKPKLHDPEPSPNIVSPTSPISSKIIKIPVDLINSLKAKVNNKETKIKLSTIEILCAHIWRCVCKARNLPKDQLIKLTIPVDGRSRLHPPVPTGYLGNVVYMAKIIASSGELVSEPLRSVTERIHKVLEQIDNNYFRSVIDYLENPRDPATALVAADTRKFPNLIITSWTSMPLGDADFGWGRPISAQPSYLLEGMAILLPPMRDEGNISLAIGLREDHLKSFETLLHMELISKY